MDERDPLLSSLCSICHIRSHKYCCPRCTALTCSLPCIKRHKQWAQCNGIRNPAAYVKQSDLATPAGIDRDYNYLTSIEREFDKAEKDAISRGVLLGESGKKKHLAKGEAKLESGLEKSQVIVTKAPKGLSRNKANATCWQKKAMCLEWTVEWVHPDGKKELAQCSEETPICNAYQAVTVKNRKRKARSSDALGPDNPAVYGKKASSSLRRARNRTRFMEDKRRKDNLPASEPPAGENVPPNLKGERGTSDDSAADVNGCPAPNGIFEAPDAKANSPNVDNSPGQPGEPSQPSQPDLSFYLHTPSLPSRHPVLSHIPNDASLQKILPNRLVLEFPTIYVFEQSSRESLPEDFITEEDFYKSARKELIEELDEEDGEIVEAVPNRADELGSIAAIENLDERRLLEILRKDLGTV